MLSILHKVKIRVIWMATWVPVGLKRSEVERETEAQLILILDWVCILNPSILHGLSANFFLLTSFDPPSSKTKWAFPNLGKHCRVDTTLMTHYNNQELFLYNKYLPGLYRFHLVSLPFSQTLLWPLKHPSGELQFLKIFGIKIIYWTFTIWDNKITLLWICFTGRDFFGGKCQGTSY